MRINDRLNTILPTVGAFRRPGEMVFLQRSQIVRIVVSWLILMSALGSAATESSAPELSTHGLISPGAATESGGLTVQQQDEPELTTPDIQIYQLYIADIESRMGAYAPGLSEQLHGLGMAYQTQGLHQAAVKVLKRSVHLARVNNGLYSEQQIPILQRLINSLVASGDYQKADEKQHYLYRVQQKIYADDVPQLTNAMLGRAEWEKQAYFFAAGKPSFSRLITMSELYRRVLSNIALHEGNTSPELLGPLSGLLNTQYLISTYQGEPKTTFEFSSSGSNEPGNPEQNRFALLRASNYRQGQAVLTAMREVHLASESENSQILAESMLALGDWHMWYKKRAPAVLAYQQAWDEIAAGDEAEVLLRSYFDEPQLLPPLADYHSDLKPPSSISGYVEVSFAINTRGRLQNLETLNVELVDPTAKAVEPNRLLRRLRKKSWRPRFLERKPVLTENIVRRYAF